MGGQAASILPEDAPTSPDFPHFTASQRPAIPASSRLLLLPLYVSQNHISRARSQMTAMVISRTASGVEAVLRLSDGQVLSLRRSALVGKGNEICSTESGIFVRLNKSSELVRISPAWTWKNAISSSVDFSVEVKEIVSEDEYAEFERLTRFHYRGKGGMGRSVSLIAKTTAWDLPTVIGFIELSSTFIANTARARFLDSPFSDPDHGVAWTRWDGKASKAFSNTIVRISRCVVHPELRGLGVSRLLVEGAILFARERWHIAGMRPSFIEITAEMLRFWPFVEGAHFHYIGETQGNRHRAAKDMRYLVVKHQKTSGMPKGGGGIMDAQRSYAKTLVEVMSRTGYKFEEILNILQSSPERLSDEDWIALHSVYRQPKPVYLKGLTEAAENFIERRLPVVVKDRRKRSVQGKKGVRARVVDIEGLRITVRAKPDASEASRRVQEAFGIVAREHFSTLVDELNVAVRPGEITLVSGPSGSGKSLLMRAIRYMVAERNSRGQLPAGVDVAGIVRGVRTAVAYPRSFGHAHSPLELLRDKPLEEALEILAGAGLAEPHLYVRPSGSLSSGQKYRLALALALAKRPDLLLVDEFCEPLDKYTAIAVCKRLRRVVSETNFAAMVATANPERVLNALRPHHLLSLSSSGWFRWYSNPSLENLVHAE